MNLFLRIKYSLFPTECLFKKKESLIEEYNNLEPVCKKSFEVWRKANDKANDYSSLEEAIRIRDKYKLSYLEYRIKRHNLEYTYNKEEEDAKANYRKKFGLLKRVHDKWVIITKIINKRKNTNKG